MIRARRQAWLAVFLIPGVLGACSAKPESKEQAPPPAATTRPVLSSSLDQIQNQYATDRPAAERKYAANAVQFTAIAATVGSDGRPDATVITFTTAAHPQPIVAHFTGAPASAVTAGAMVQAKCDSIAVVHDKPELAGCSLRP
jgi:hypothetical protein